MVLKFPASFFQPNLFGPQNHQLPWALGWSCILEDSSFEEDGKEPTGHVL